MPYIKQDWRDVVDDGINALLSKMDINESDEVYYVFFNFSSGYFYRSYMTERTHAQKYDKLMNDLIDKARTVEANGNECGVLNYILSMLCNGLIGSEMKYKKINRLIGILSRAMRNIEDDIYEYDLEGAFFCALLELYRRKGAPYENQKARENGDVY